MKFVPKITGNFERSFKVIPAKISKHDKKFDVIPAVTFELKQKLNYLMYVEACEV